MYLSFFGLNEKPFAITPDPRYLFLSERHAEALAHLVYGINEAGGFVQLTGEVGTGKTTIIRSLLAQAPRNAEVALILNPRITAPEFLLTICEELGIGVPDAAVGSVKDLVDILNRYLLRAHAEGRRVVLVVDEAQNLAPDVLEQVRLLTNLETETQKLLQIILIGQPELRELLGRTELRQLAQRVTGRYHLDPLSRDESAAYLRHRLRVAGATSDIFTPSALRETHRLSEGVPRLINVISDRALLGAYTQDRHKVSSPLVLRAAGEVFGRRILPAWLPWLIGAGGLIAALLVGSLAWRSYQQRDRADSMTAITAPAGFGGGAAAKPAANNTATGASAAGSAAAGPGGAAPAAANSAAASTTPLASWLATVELGSAKNAGFASLFAQWHLALATPGADACVQAQTAGLSCLTQRGSLAQLSLYNRPALLTLVDAQGVSREVALVRLSGDRATLMSGSGVHETSLADLTRYWFGDYTLLWQPGALGPRTLAFGARGASVRQLRTALRRVAKLPPAITNTASYDSELVQLVEDFQRRNRLTVDGVAGVQTLVALDAALAAPGTPLLSGVNPDPAVN